MKLKKKRSRSLLMTGILSLLLVSVSLGTPAQAQQVCGKVHLSVTEKPTQVFEAKTDRQKEIVAQLNALMALKPFHISAEALKTVFDHELPIFQENLSTITGLAIANNGFEPGLIAFYESKFYPMALKGPRLHSLKEGLHSGNILSILGDLTARDTLVLFTGGKPGKVVRDSLVGRYLQETGVRLQSRAYKEVGGRDLTGPERLLIPVDATTHPIFLKYLGNQQAYSVTGHANIVFDGFFYPFSGDKKIPNALAANTPLPFVLLKTTEGARLKRYLEAVVTHAPNNWGTELKKPWMIPGYLSQNGYFGCCTHWHGNLPVGDKQVSSIILPGAGDKPAEVQVSAYNADENAHYKNIWTAPMHEPISAVLGLAENNGRGEFASPGWVIQSLLVSAPVDRVPFVIYYTADAKVPVDANSALNVERPW